MHCGSNYYHILARVELWPVRIMALLADRAGFATGKDTTYETEPIERAAPGGQNVLERLASPTFHLYGRGYGPGRMG
jgi:hypothetical protein